MNWIASIFIALVTALIACIGTGFVASLCVRWYRMSQFEGAAGYFVVFLGLFGGIVGLVIGLVVARLIVDGTTAGFVRAAGGAIGSIVVLMTLGALIARLLAEPPPGGGRHKPREFVADPQSH